MEEYLMKNKFSSLCIITSLLMGSTNINAAYYVYSPQYIPDDAFVTAPCEQPRCPYVVKHHYHSGVKHHRYHYHHKYHYDQTCSTPVRPSHYSIKTYYVYGSPCGDTLWVPSPCNDYNSTCVNAREYHRAFYGPYYETGCNQYQYNADFDMDMRTGDDVYKW